MKGILKGFRVAPLVLLFWLFGLCPSVMAYGYYSELSYDGQFLGGFAATWLDYGEGEVVTCAYESSGWCVVYGITEYSVFTEAELLTPSYQWADGGADWQWDYSQVQYGAAASMPGSWTATSVHELRWDYWLVYCSEGCSQPFYQYSGASNLDTITIYADVPTPGLTSIGFTPDSIEASGCTTLGWDPQFPAIDFVIHRIEDDWWETEYGYPNGNVICVEAEEEYYYGHFEITQVRVPGGLWSVPPQPVSLLIQGPPLATYDVRIQAFIPYAWVSDGETCAVFLPTILGGDNRSFDRNGSYRLRGSAAMAPRIGTVPSSSKESGVSHRYERFSSVGTDTGGFVVPASDSILGDCYKLHDENFATVANVHMDTTGSATDHWAQIHFWGFASQPFNSLAPAIDFDITLKLTKPLDHTTYDVTWQHDCFPAFEIWIGNQKIYGRFPDAGDFGTIGLCLTGVSAPRSGHETGDVE